MREIRQSGSEGGVADNGHPYPYTSPGWNPGDRRPHVSRSEGTLHTTEWPRPALALCGVPSERPDFAPIYPQGSTLGWYAQPRWGRRLSFGLHSEPPQRGRGWYCGLICCHSLGNLRVALKAAVWRDGPEDGAERRPKETVWRGRDPLQDRVASPISSSALGYHIKTVSFFGPWAPRTRIRSISPVRLGPVTREIIEGQWVPWSCSIRWKASVRSPSN